MFQVIHDSQLLSSVASQSRIYYLTKSADDITTD